MSWLRSTKGGRTLDMYARLIGDRQRCRGTTKLGRQCRRWTYGIEVYCHWHDPNWIKNRTRKKRGGNESR